MRHSHSVEDDHSEEHPALVDGTASILHVLWRRPSILPIDQSGLLRPATDADSVTETLGSTQKPRGCGSPSEVVATS